MKSTVNALKNFNKTQLISALQQAQSALRERDNVISILQEKLRLAGANIYGARSEQRGNDAQADLFNEVDALASPDAQELEACSVATEESADESSQEISADTQTITYERRKTGGRKALPESLPRVEIELDIPEADKVCACGCQKNRIGSDSSERLEIVPAKLFVERHIRYKYACPQCEDGVQIAATVPTMIPKSNAGPGLLAYVVTAKYQDALPLHRKRSINHRSLDRQSINPPRQQLLNISLATCFGQFSK